MAGWTTLFWNLLGLWRDVNRPRFNHLSYGRLEVVRLALPLLRDILSNHGCATFESFYFIWTRGIILISQNLQERRDGVESSQHCLINKKAEEGGPCDLRSFDGLESGSSCNLLDATRIRINADRANVRP